MSLERKLVCRKCGDNYLTIKCGKNNHESKLESKSESKPERVINKWVNNDNKEKRNHFKRTYTVKLAELLLDMTEEELMELTHEWGHIIRIRLNTYEESSTTYIEFGFEKEADYFVKALDKTPL